MVLLKFTVCLLLIIACTAALTVSKRDRGPSMMFNAASKQAGEQSEDEEDEDYHESEVSTMNKMIWILIFGLTALMAQTTSAIECYWCDSRLNKLCGEPFGYIVDVTNCPVETTECFKIKVQAEGKSGEATAVLRGCADQREVKSGCLHGEQTIKSKDESTVPVKQMGDVCLCGKDLCNEGEKFQPKLKLLMIAIAVTTALMNILFN